MATPVSYTREQILDAAMEAVHEHWRSATVAQVSAKLGAPSGSIYHRFRSRDVLFVSAWVRSIKRFHRELEQIGTADPVEAITKTALLIPRFCRAHPLDARMMTAYRYSDLMKDPHPDLLPELTNLNDPVRETIDRLTLARYGRVTPQGLAIVALACRETPIGLIRPMIGDEIPLWIDEAVRAASTAIAQLPDA
ncbi:TetR/AcrR family transcriptional regulator [Arthrobacter sp. ISL-95]|uniref:TetR/AcrR family transcriptional regulator n=1 Tax=Arthrobacter sp. ISL-95 TaxID=2819116 RepID=UPI001BE55C8D|nr:TetR/AcrR family transcriptional regulator [Arthrobacter sp. ISL-95]MBT2588335.1 TetR/AcrR family transcriptional regulator [Arthrobacter sp. ISL-95]